MWSAATPSVPPSSKQLFLIYADMRISDANPNPKCDGVQQALVGMEAFSGRVNEGCCGPEYAGYHGNASAVNISDRDYDDAMNLYVR